MFIMFSESALENVKTMKQRCSALITSGISTRVPMRYIHFGKSNFILIKYRGHMLYLYQ